MFCVFFFFLIFDFEVLKLSIEMEGVKVEQVIFLFYLCNKILLHITNLLYGTLI